MKSYFTIKIDLSGNSSQFKNVFSTNIFYKYNTYFSYNSTNLSFSWSQ